MITGKPLEGDEYGAEQIFIGQQRGFTICALHRARAHATLLRRAPVCAEAQFYGVFTWENGDNGNSNFWSFPDKCILLLSL